MGIHQSFCVPILRDLGGLTRDELYRALSDIGYEAVEIWGRGEDFDELVETAKKHGLVVASMCGHASLGDGLNKPENHDRIESELTESIDLAVRHGIPGLICFSGNRNPGQSDYEGLVECARVLRRIAPYAQDQSVNLNVELLNSKVDHPLYQCDRTGWGVALCEMVNSPRVKLLFDIYHMQIMEGDVIRSLQKAIGWIGHFHTAGNPGRQDLDDAQELNYRGICRAISDTGYGLYLGHEFRPKGGCVDAARAAFAVCDV